MRTFRNGTLKWMNGDGKARYFFSSQNFFFYLWESKCLILNFVIVHRLPPYNEDRVPLQNSPSPHKLRRLSPERMFGIYLKLLKLILNDFYGKFCVPVLGDPRTNQNPAFLTLGILFYRWHNVLARRSVHHTFPNL